jgi:RHS repeat-associated protein
LGYDAENRLTSVQTSAGTATFTYDSDGSRVKGTVGGVTTTYIGNYFEWTGSTSTMKKYYYAGSIGVAMRTGSGTGTTGVNWLFGDHLGSQSVTADASGCKIAEVRYKAWGEDRYVWGTTPTSYRYTGQRSETSLSIYYYGARRYDSSLGRFLSPDTIVPEASQGVQAWDRMAYANNNPVRYIDPTGHDVGCSAANPACADSNGLSFASQWQMSAATMGIRIKNDLASNGRLNPVSDWVVSNDTPVGRLTYSTWAMGNVADSIVSGGEGLSQSVTDLAIVLGNNLTTGMMGLSMGGDVEGVAPVGGVYSINNPNGQVIRVGRTNNLLIRQGQYNRDPNSVNHRFKPEYYTDDYATQRGLEQMLYDQFQPPMNFNRPIRIGNPNTSNYINSALDFLAGLFGGQ